MAAKCIRCVVVAEGLELSASSLCPAGIFFTNGIGPTPGNALLPRCFQPTSQVLLLTAALTFSGTIRRRGRTI